jgi:hypothetical protein
MKIFCLDHEVVTILIPNDGQRESSDPTGGI